MEKSMSLYEISTELKPLDEALELAGGSLGDISPELVDRVMELITASQAKVDAYGHYAKSIQATIAAIDDEMQRLSERKQVFKNRLAKLKGAADRAMEARGITKIEGELHTISRVKNGGRPSIVLKVEPKDLPAYFQKTEIVADMELLRNAYESKDAGIEGLIEVQDTGYSVRIK